MAFLPSTITLGVLMKKFLVKMRVEVDENVEHDILIEKLVHAPDKSDAVNSARELVRTENTEINHLKIYSWQTEQRYN
jgi:hypothetical protein